MRVVLDDSDDLVDQFVMNKFWLLSGEAAWDEAGGLNGGKDIKDDITVQVGIDEYENLLFLFDICLSL